MLAWLVSAINFWDYSARWQCSPWRETALREAVAATISPTESQSHLSKKHNRPTNPLGRLSRVTVPIAPGRNRRRWFPSRPRQPFVIGRLL
jgi:hypothetical protein